MYMYMYIVYCILYIVYCTLYIVYCILYIVYVCILKSFEHVYVCVGVHLKQCIAFFLQVVAFILEIVAKHHVGIRDWTDWAWTNHIIHSHLALPPLYTPPTTVQDNSCSTGGTSWGTTRLWVALCFFLGLHLDHFGHWVPQNRPPYPISGSAGSPHTFASPASPGLVWSFQKHTCTMCWWMMLVPGSMRHFKHAFQFSYPQFRSWWRVYTLILLQGLPAQQLLIGTMPIMAATVLMPGLHLKAALDVGNCRLPKPASYEDMYMPSSILQPLCGSAVS